MHTFWVFGLWCYTECRSKLSKIGFPRWPHSLIIRRNIIAQCLRCDYGCKCDVTILPGCFIDMKLLGSIAQPSSLCVEALCMILNHKYIYKNIYKYTHMHIGGTERLTTTQVCKCISPLLRHSIKKGVCFLVFWPFPWWSFHTLLQHPHFTGPVEMDHFHPNPYLKSIRFF